MYSFPPYISKTQHQSFRPFVGPNTFCRPVYGDQFKNFLPAYVVPSTMFPINVLSGIIIYFYLICVRTHEGGCMYVYLDNSINIDGVERDFSLPPIVCRKIKLMYSRT